MNGFYNKSFTISKIKKTADKLTIKSDKVSLVTVLFVTNNGGRYEERTGKEDCLKTFCLLKKIKLHKKYILNNNRKVFIGKKDNTSSEVLGTIIEMFEEFSGKSIKSKKVMHVL